MEEGMIHANDVGQQVVVAGEFNAPKESNSVPNPDKMNFHLFWLYSRGEYDECLRVLDAWQNASCVNYPYALMLKG
jgi:hypothetical protein